MLLKLVREDPSLDQLTFDFLDERMGGKSVPCVPKGEGIKWCQKFREREREHVC